jgi:hypothetical protein
LIRQSPGVGTGDIELHAKSHRMHQNPLAICRFPSNQTGGNPRERALLWPPPLQCRLRHHEPKAIVSCKLIWKESCAGNNACPNYKMHTIGTDYEINTSFTSAPVLSFTLLSTAASINSLSNCARNAKTDVPFPFSLHLYSHQTNVSFCHLNPPSGHCSKK